MPPGTIEQAKRVIEQLRLDLVSLVDSDGTVETICTEDALLLLFYQSPACSSDWSRRSDWLREFHLARDRGCPTFIYEINPAGFNTDAGEGQSWVREFKDRSGVSTTKVRTVSWLLVPIGSDLGLLGHDPQEDDISLRATFRDVDEEVNRLTDRMFTKHPELVTLERVWHLRGLLLRAHGIDWRSPAEMNPGVSFD